eukprot:scaffold1302_cov114-Isochrysis_galbana.AAC.15
MKSTIAWGVGGSLRRAGEEDAGGLVLACGRWGVGECLVGRHPRWGRGQWAIGCLVLACLDPCRHAGRSCTIVPFCGLHRCL